MHTCCCEINAHLGGAVLHHYSSTAIHGTTAQDAKKKLTSPTQD